MSARPLIRSLVATGLPRRLDRHLGHKLRLRYSIQRCTLCLQRRADLLIHRLNRLYPAEADSWRSPSATTVVTW